MKIADPIDQLDTLICQVTIDKNGIYVAKQRITTEKQRRDVLYALREAMDDVREAQI